MLRLQLSQGSTAATTKSNLDERCQLKVGPVSPLLREHVGQRQRAWQKYPRNERCRPRLGARSRQHSGQDGPRLSGERKRREKDQTSYTIASAKLDSPAVENRYRQPATPLLTRSDSSQHNSIKEIGTLNGARNSKVV
jgi:hypothetical protein